jgi:sugar/nucleoside kinase (ribokinase family)
MSKCCAEQIREAPPIVIVSTSTRDWLPDGEKRASCIPGGPAHYIALALDRLHAPYRLVTHQSVDVDVVHTRAGEAYVIPAIEPIPLPERLHGSAVILSPIIREIDPFHVPPVDGLLIVDVQGFVREPGVRSDRVSGPYHLAPLLLRADVVKAAEAELALLDDASKVALAGTTALITGGEHGARLDMPEGTFPIPVNRIDTEHTIGAGDTFLAAMTWALVRGCSLEESALDAARFTEEVLLSRGRSVALE